MKKAVITIIFVLWGQIAFSQNIVKGTITNQNNAPLVGANILVQQLNKIYLADSAGKFEIKGLPNGKLTIQISHIGYKTHSETFVLSNSTIEKNFELLETPIETDEIVISSGFNNSEHENTVKIEIIRFNENKVLNQNLNKDLSKIAGLEMISKGIGIVRPVIRGLAMSNVMVLYNGFRFENYQFSDHHPLGIDEFGIEKVELIKGPASLLYGSDAIGGVLNFISEKPAPIGKTIFEYNLKLFSNSLGITNNFAVKSSSQKFYIGIRIGNHSSADYVQGGGQIVPNSRFNSTNLNLFTGFNNSFMSSQLIYNMNLSNVGITSEHAIEHLSNLPRSRKPVEFYMPLKSHFVLTKNKFFLNKYKIELNASYQNYNLVHIEEKDEAEIDMKLNTLNYETIVHLPSSEGNDYIIGYKGYYQINVNSQDAEEQLLPNANVLNNSFFALLQHKILKKLKIQSGIRYDFNSLKTQSVGLENEPEYRPALNLKYASINGSFGIIANINDKFVNKINIATGYRTPNLPELTSKGLHEGRYEVGNKDLIPVKSFELDYNFHSHQKCVTFDILLFLNQIKNFIYIAPTNTFTTDSFRIFQFTQSDAFLYGLETGLHLHPEDAQWLHFEINYEKVIGKKNDGSFLPLIPADKINSEITLKAEKSEYMKNKYLKINIEKAFQQTRVAPNEDVTPAYWVIDIGIGSSIKLNGYKLDVDFAVNNVFDKKYIDHLSTLKEVGYFNPGRNFILSIKLLFELK